MIEILALDHVHLAVPDLAHAQVRFGPLFGGSFTPVYGGPEMNAFGTWNTSGGDFIQPIRLGERIFGGAPIAAHGILSISLRVANIDAGIAQAARVGLRVRSRVSSEDVGFGVNVVQAQLSAEESCGLGLELVEHQLPGPHVPLTAVVDYVEHYVTDLESAAQRLGAIFGSAFEPPFTHAGSRSARHERLGVQLTEARYPGGLHTRAIAFRSRDLARDVAGAEARGERLVARRSLPDGTREAEFEHEAGVIVKLVQRTH